MTANPAWSAHSIRRSAQIRVIWGRFGLEKDLNLCTSSDAVSGPGRVGCHVWYGWKGQCKGSLGLCSNRAQPLSLSVRRQKCENGLFLELQVDLPLLSLFGERGKRAGLRFWCSRCSQWPPRTVQPPHRWGRVALCYCTREPEVRYP